MKIDLSREQLTVVALAALVVAAGVLVTPAAVFPTDTSPDDARAGESYSTTSGGMMEVPDDHTQTTPQSGKETVEAPPRVQASQGAQTMRVSVTEQDGDVALQLADDRIHDGRWVSLPASWFEEEIGRVPQVAYIQHSSGSEYETRTHVRGDDVAFYVEEFSSNSVTFSGSVSVDGNFSDGGSGQYNLSNLDSASDVAVNLTGVVNGEYENATGSVTGASSTVSMPVAGDLAPTDGQGGNPVVSVTAPSDTGTYNPVTAEGDGATDFAVNFVGDNADDTGMKTALRVTPSSDKTLGEVLIDYGYTNGGAYDYNVSIYLQQGETFSGDYTGGTLVKSGWSPTHGVANETVTFDSVESLSGGSSYWLSFVTQSSDGDGTRDSITIDVDDSAGSTYFYDIADRSQAYYADVTVSGTPPTDVAVSDDDGHSHTFGDLAAGETASAPLNLSTDTSKLTFSSANGAPFSYDVTLQERTGTMDAAVELNTESVSVDGVLNESETVTKTINKSALQEGENTITASVGDGSLSSDAPAPKVGVSLSHDATNKQSVEYDGGQWIESYNVSETYASQRGEASLTVPFQADVYAIQNVEAQVNDSGWQSVDAANYSLANTTLDVDLDAVHGSDGIPAGTTMHVRTTGIAVDPINSSITVTEPTAPGKALNSTVQIDAWDADASLDVSGTSQGSRLHYTSNETWDNTQDEVYLGADGTQRLELPAATAGDQFRVRTLPLELAPETGEVRASVPDDRVNETEPVYKVMPGDSTGDAYEVTFLDATGGEDYILWSETNEVVVDSGTASSPLTLTDDEDNTAVLQFLVDEGTSSSSSSGGGDGGSAIIGTPTTGGDTNIVPLVGIALAAGGVIVASRNNGVVTEKGESASESIEGVLGRIPVAGPALGKGLGGLVESLAGLLDTVTANRTLALSIVTALLLGAVQGGIIEVPQSSLTIIVVAGVGIYTGVALREFGEWSLQRWAGIMIATTVVTLQQTSQTDILTAIVESDVWPILALGGLYLAYQAVKGLRQPDNPTNIVLEADQSTDGDGGGGQ